MNQWLARRVAAFPMRHGVRAGATPNAKRATRNCSLEGAARHAHALPKLGNA